MPQQTGLVDRTVTLVNLLPHVNYTIRVAAVNGVSDFSDLSKPQYVEVNISTSFTGTGHPWLHLLLYSPSAPSCELLKRALCDARILKG